MRKLSKKEIYSYIENEICEIPILYHCENIAFSVAEDFRSKVCVPCWYDCREIFHADYLKPNHVFINHKNVKTQHVDNFLKSVENKLNIKKGSKVFKTARKTATIIFLSSFWRNKMRFSLLTLILRVGVYNKLEYYDSKIFKKCKYLHDTRSAVRLFFQGYTNYEGNKNNWHEEFSYKTIAECKKKLFE